jgi:hypothetical protein
MVMRVLTRSSLLGLSALLTVSITGWAQTLSARPGNLEEPTVRSASQYGDVVLGRTTLIGAQRVFADEMSRDEVRVPRLHGANPSRHPETKWKIGQAEVTPHFQLDLGPEYYTLYFDQNERLLAAITRNLPRSLTGTELKSRYPALREDRVWRSGNTPRFTAFSLRLSPCVMLTAHVTAADDQVEQIGYVYTCSTTPIQSADNSGRP